MKVGGLLTDGCTNSIGHNPVSSCKPCAASGMRNGCCARSWIPSWFRAGWNATVMATCSVLRRQLNCHLPPRAVATAEEKRCAEGEELLRRKCRTPPAGTALVDGRRHCLLCPCQLSSHWQTQQSFPPGAESVAPRGTAGIRWHYKELFEKENGKTIYLESSSVRVYIYISIYIYIRDAFEPVWSRTWHCACLWYTITDTLIHLHCRLRWLECTYARWLSAPQSLGRQSWMGPKPPEAARRLQRGPPLCEGAAVFCTQRCLKNPPWAQCWWVACPAGHRWPLPAQGQVPEGTALSARAGVTDHWLPGARHLSVWPWHPTCTDILGPKRSSLTEAPVLPACSMGRGRSMCLDGQDTCFWLSKALFCLLHRARVFTSRFCFVRHLTLG